ncbi:MAG: histidinol dehydrogenase, partial [Proteobacteria bacterium]|nr:histidinol dehydrogenase [Pseudomonadota bacterium]
MTLRLEQSAVDFSDRFAELVASRRQVMADVDRDVAEIIAAVRQGGDAALLEFTKRFDRVALTTQTLRIGGDEIAASATAVSADQRTALQHAADRIRSYHLRQMPADDWYVDSDGVGLGTRWTAIGAVGVYVPGGTAAYPSSVLMNVVPARVAGVERIAMVVPTPDGALNPMVLAAAHIAGVNEIYRVGGAQAVAALAYGTATIAPVDKIVGPGNAYVASAKRQVFGTVGIDMIAGPSEILVVADAGSDPAWIAADLLSQAEHDADAQSILVTDDPSFAESVETAVDRLLAELPRGKIARDSWQEHGAIVILDTLDAAPPLIDRLAPEHVELAIAEPQRLAPAIRNAGAIFLGRYTPEAIGDYVAGPNHVLPTARSARFASGLSVLDFMKRTSLIECDGVSIARIGPTAVI